MVSGTEFGYGESMVEAHYREWECNLLITLGDVTPLGIIPDLAATDKILWVAWAAVDWLGLPKNILHRIRPAHKLVPFSMYGENALRKAGLPNVEKAIWLGLNTDIWKPRPREDFPKVMRSLGYEYDTFNLLIVAANQERKRVRQQLEAIALFRRVHPEAQVRLYLHSFQKGDRDLNADLDELGLADINAFPDAYFMTQGGFREDEMAMIFSCADVVLNCAMEGFGYAQVQAQACGVPVICLSEGAGPELVQFGWETAPMGVDVVPHQMGQPLPNPIAIAKALEELWERRVKAGMPLRSEAAARWVQENLAWDRIAEEWYGVIDRCMEDRVRYSMDLPEPSPELLERAKRMVELP